MLLKVNREGLEAALASIGAHADSLPIFAHKAEIIPFKLLGVRTPAANKSSRRCWQWAATL